MAIGEDPKGAPAWALEACRSYYLQRKVEVESDGRGRPPRQSVEDGLLLELVARLIVGDELSLTAAVTKVTGQGSDGTDFRRLMRIWKRHLVPALLVIEGGKPEKTNKWLRIAEQEEQEKFMADCRKQAVAEIAAGDLNTDLDPAEEANRRKHARWFNFSSELNPEQDAQIKIAPLSKAVFVAEIKKRILLTQPDAQGDDETP